MQIQQIQSRSFEGKKRYLNTEQLKNVKVLLTKMNGETDLKQSEYFFSSTITKELQHDKKNHFIDGRMLFDKVSEKKQMQGNTLFTLGKTELVIDNSTGEIVDYHKPFFVRWKKVFKNIDKVLTAFTENFSNQDVVKKKRITLEGYTQKGVAIIDKLKGKVK